MRSLRQLVDVPVEAISVTPEAIDQSGRVFAFCGTGGSGATSLSVSIAAEFSARQKKVLMVDMDFFDPSLVVHFGIRDFPAGLVAASRLAYQGRLDYLSLEELCIKVATNGSLRLLPGMTAPNRFKDLSPEALLKLLIELRALFEVIILDMGSIRPNHGLASDLQTALIGHADGAFTIFVAEPEGIAKLMWQEPKSALIANRYRPGVLGSNGRKQLKQTIAELSDQALIAILPETDDFDLAIRGASPLRDLVRKSEYLSAVSELVDSLDVPNTTS